MIEDEVIVRLRVPPRRTGRRSGFPYPDCVVRQVRALWETTRLTVRVIADRTGVSTGTVTRWAHAGVWRRPPGAPRAWDDRPGARRRADVRRCRAIDGALDEAEARIAALEAGGRVDPERLEAAIVALQLARALRGPGARAAGRPAARPIAAEAHATADR